MPISLTGSLNLSGSNTLIGTKTITGSVFISGSKTIIGTTSITGSLLVTGSLNTVGTITATTLVVQTITSSISSITGSTNFGSLLTNTHVFSGSVTMNPGGLFISSSGLVGIGNVVPAYKLEVTGTGKYSSTLLVGDDLTVNGWVKPNGIYAFTADSGTTYIQQPSGGTISIRKSDSTPFITILNSGNVGIGTSSPGAILHTLKSGTAVTGIGDETFIGQRSNGAENASIAIISNALGVLRFTNPSSTELGAIFYDNSNNYMAFKVNSAERMRITSGGDLYIGSATTDKNGRLIVYGQSSDGNYYTFRCYSAGSDILFGVRTDGYINTGTFTSSPYNLVRTGRVMMVDSGGGVGYQSSTRESKTNINNLTDISFLYQLNPVSFNYRKTDGISNTFTDEYNEDLHYGLIADEVEKVNKELVFYNEKNGQKEIAGVEYGKLTAVLIKAIQELTARVQYLENK
jgi:hypothetical protein